MKEENIKAAKPNTLPPSKIFACAFVASETDLLFYPLTTLTKRCQYSIAPLQFNLGQIASNTKPSTTGILKSLQNAQSLGINKLYAGVTYAALNKGISRTFRWYSQEKIQGYMSRNFSDALPTSLSDEKKKTFFSGLAGVTTGLIETTALQPLDTLKTRKQVGVVSNNTTYASLGVNAARTSLAAGCFFTTYQAALNQAKDKNNPTTLEKLTSATAAGLLTSILTNPLDVIKTRMQASANKNSNAATILKDVVTREGIMALTKGTSFKLLETPGKSILPFFMFQAAKKFLESQSRPEENNTLTSTKANA